MLAGVKLVIELALEEKVAIDLAVAERADGVADGLRGVGGVRHMLCELRDGGPAALATLGLGGAGCMRSAAGYGEGA